MIISKKIRYQVLAETASAKAWYLIFFLLILHPNGQQQKNLAPILEIGANRLEGIFCYLLF